MPLLKLTPIRGLAKPASAQDGKITIGRGPDNTIPLIDERASRRHCVIELDQQNCWIVRDLNSRNGTKVNDAKVNAAILKPGDVLTFEYSLKPRYPLRARTPASNRRSGRRTSR